LWEATVDGDGGEVTLAEKTVKFAGSTDGFDKNDDLVEFEGIKEVVEFAVLLGFGEADKVLLEAVQGQLGLVINVNLEWLKLVEYIRGTHVLHEFLADWADFLRQCGREHHDLFVFRGCPENILDIPSHVYMLD
jgi:hypothetical protein